MAHQYDKDIPVMLRSASGDHLIGSINFDLDGRNPIRSKFGISLNQSRLNAKRVGKHIRDLPYQDSAELMYLPSIWRRCLVRQRNLIFRLSNERRIRCALQFLGAQMAAI